MKIETTQAYLNNNINIKILGDLEVELNVDENRLGIPVNSLLTMAGRKNKKREFLFVSKVLAKHIPLKPQSLTIVGQLLGYMMAERDNKLNKEKITDDMKVLARSLYDVNFASEAATIIATSKIELDEPTLFIGFAETATGLGHAMYSAFSKNAGFIHTTRDIVEERTSLFEFKEEHSHAMDHYCYTLEDDFINRFSKVVLVDDEMTTGRTSLNLIKVFDKKYPGKKYTLASLLNWCSAEDTMQFEIYAKEFGVSVDFISLIKGRSKQIGNLDNYIAESQDQLTNNEISVKTIAINTGENKRFTFVDTSGNKKEVLYANYTGRFGITVEDNNRIDKILSETANKLKQEREFEKCLCLGFGEFIYIPAIVTEKMGHDIMFYSSTRSPIYPVNKEEYGIKSAIEFENPYDTTITNYIYNILPNMYEEIFMFLERDINDESKKDISTKLSQMGVKSLKFVVLC